MSTCFINEGHPNFTKGLTQDLPPLQGLRKSGLLEHTISTGRLIQSFQGHTHVSHALGRPEKMCKSKHIRWVKPPRLDLGFSRLVCYKEHGLEQQTNLGPNHISYWARLVTTLSLDFPTVKVKILPPKVLSVVNRLRSS